jgi:pimeloyl-ACP methyl ester carboxylesterase
MERVEATTADGVRLALAHVPAVGARRAVALCTHAMMANGRYFGAGRDGGFAATLAAAGVDVVVLDWRGHGGSRPPSPGADDWSFDEYVELDLPAALAAAGRIGGVAADEVAVIGHSLGGLAALAALGRGIVRVRRLALAATSLWLPGRSGPLARRAIMEGYDLAARVLGRAPIRALRLGSDDESAGYVAQLAGWARTGRWTSRGGIDHMALLPRIDAPVWAVSGAGDRLCTPADARVLLARLRGAAPLRVVGTAHGDAIDPDHFQLFTDRRLAPLWNEVAAFVIGS